MSGKEVILTTEGIVEIEKKLEELKTVKRQEIAEQIKVARSFGDITENAEYDEAKNEQARIEGEILQLENTLRVAKVIDDTTIDVRFVGIGTTVKVFDLESKEHEKYTIVGSTEANPTQLKISNESPVGKALLGQQIGNIVDVVAPGGLIHLQILEINR
ncbi:MAG: transcription elongation factor GreA [Christensenellales bacterium]